LAGNQGGLHFSLHCFLAGLYLTEQMFQHVHLHVPKIQSRTSDTSCQVSD
jgi:hypothetical protein